MNNKNNTTYQNIIIDPNSPLSKIFEGKENLLSGIIEKFFPGVPDFSSHYHKWGNLFPEKFGSGTSRSITFNVTEDCQMRCSYCYQANKNDKNKMSFDTAKMAIDRIFEEDLSMSKERWRFGEEDGECAILEFIGGEPFLEIELIDQICEYFLLKACELNHRWKNHYMISFSTNGLLYFDEKVQKFFKKYTRHRISLGITIDGNKELHDSCRRTKEGLPTFDIVEKAYKDALLQKYTYSTKITISPTNLKFLSNAIKKMSSYQGVSLIPANPVFEEEWTIDQAKEYYFQLKDLADWIIENNIYKKIDITLFDYNIGSPIMNEKGELIKDLHFCGSTGNMLAIATNGDFYPCMRFIPFSLFNQEKREDYIIGTAEKGLGFTEKQRERLIELENTTYSKRSPEKCMKCLIANGCTSCAGWDYDKNGKVFLRDTGICNMHKARTLINCYYWNKLFKKANIPFIKKCYLSKEEIYEIVGEKEWDTIKDIIKF